MSVAVRAAACAVVLTLAAAPPAAAETERFVGDASSFVLDNGLKVVVIPDHRAPVVTHMVWYLAGAVDDPPGKSGIAHFLEHLMFKGTRDHPEGEFSRVINSVGGSQNAFTTDDYTVYHQTVARQHLGTMMSYEADRMANLVINDAAVIPERDVILEERRSRVENQPSALLGEAMSATLFVNSGYGIPTIGWEHEMATLDREDAIAFYDRFYTPNNAIVIIAGDTTEDEVRALAEETYGKVERRAEPPPRLRPREPIPVTERTVTMTDPRVTQPSVRRAYVVPSYTTGEPGDAIALDLLAEIIGSGTTSRMYRDLIVDKAVATAAGAYYRSGPLGDTQFVVYGVPRGETSLDDLLDELDAVLAGVIENGITEEELARAKRRIRAGMIYAQDNSESLARIFGSALATGQTLAEIQNWPAQLDAVTPEQIADTARKYFPGRGSVTGYLVGSAVDGRS